MTEQENLLRLKSLFDQLHLTNLYENDFRQVYSAKEYLDFIDKILDEIIVIQRVLGLRN